MRTILPSTYHGGTGAEPFTNFVSLSATTPCLQGNDFYQKLAIPSTSGDVKFRFPLETLFTLTSMPVMSGSPSHPARARSQNSVARVKLGVAMDCSDCAYSMNQKASVSSTGGNDLEEGVFAQKSLDGL
ncbi:hypothetical protein MTP99_001329 [Tenebrio molitor]|nr:hypothetical protein MTP99_001329 [Tenebrio molitor]